MTSGLGVGLFFVLLIGGMAVMFIWAWLGGRREDRERREVVERWYAGVERRREEARAEARTHLASLSPDEIRARLRVSVCRHAPSEAQLPPGSWLLAEDLACRLIVEEFPLQEIDPDVRARLPEDDASLARIALEQTFAAPLEAGAQRAPNGWLAAPDRLLGAVPSVLAGAGADVVWRALPVDVEALAALAANTPIEGPLKHAMFFWDGARLEQISAYAHTVIGPTTPHFTLRLPASMRAMTDLPTDPTGRIGVRRR